MALERVTRELIDLTPKMAAEFLAKNEGNRRLSEQRVRRLADEIVRGGWEFNGQPIILDDDGNLLDGQHRCAAVVASKKSVRCLLVRGVARRAFATIDAGRARSASDVLAAGGHKNSARMAAALRLAWQDTLGVLGSGAATHQPGNADIAALIDDHPDIAGAGTWVNRYQHTANAPCAFMYWRTMRGNKPEAEAFWNAVTTGEGLSRGSPALRLRDILFHNLRERAKRPARDVLEFIIRAWVCYLANHEVQLLKIGILEHGAMRPNGEDIVIPMTREAAEAVVYEGRKSVQRRERKVAAHAS